jgi:hypothetical protein
MIFNWFYLVKVIENTIHLMKFSRTYTVKTNFNSTCTTQERKTFPPPRQKISYSMAEKLFEKDKQCKISNFHNSF